MLGLFGFGYLVCDNSFGPLPLSFLLFTALNAGACGLLLTRLRGSPDRTLWIWVALVVLLNGYFVQLYILAAHLHSPQYITANFYDIRWVTARHLLSAYPWITLGFVTFCVSVWIASFRRTPDIVRPAAAGEGLFVGRAIHLLALTFLGYIFSTLIQQTLSYGVLGATHVSVPLHVDAILPLYQRNVAPSLMLLAAWVFERAGRPVLVRLTVAALAICALLDSFTTTSRGAWLYYLAPVFIFWLLTGTASRARYLLVGSALVVSVALFPTLSNLRAQKVSGAAPGQGNSVSVLTSASYVFLRVGSGEATGVVQTLDHRGRMSLSRLLHFARPNVIGLYYTNNVVRVTAPNDFRAPGMIASLMIVGGAPGIVLVIPLLVALIEAIWSRLRRLRCWPVALPLASVVISVFVSGGVFDFLLLLKLVLGVALSELVYVRLLTRPVATPRLTREPMDA